MASIEKRPNKGGISYRVIWLQRDAVPPRQTETFDDEYAAGRFRVDVEEAGNRWPKDWIRGVGYRATAKPEALADAARKSNGTVAEWALAWIDSDRCRAQVEAKLKYRNIVRDHIAGRPIGAIALSDVTREDVQTWLQELADKPLGYKTIKNIRGQLSAALSAAVAEHKLAANPVDHCAIPADKEDARPPVFLERDEYDTILLGIPLEHRTLIETLAGTGLRWPGEAVQLTVRDVDFSRAPAAIRIHKARKPSLDGNHRVGRTKSAAGMRTIPISAKLAALLAAHVQGRSPSELLFPNIGNTGTWWRNIWDPAVNHADLPVRPRPYDLRHSHASWLLADNQTLFAVSKRLGHKNIQITSDTYGHLDRSGNEGLLASLEAM